MFFPKVSYAIAVVDGKIRAQINAGQGLLILTTRSSSGPFNDGRPHVVLLQKEDLRWENNQEECSLFLRLIFKQLE